MRRFLTAAAALLPSRLAVLLLRLIGHKVKPRVKIGFSLLLVDRLYLDENSDIGHFNLVSCRRIVLRQAARIGNMNVVLGPVSVWLGNGSKLGNRNQIRRAKPPVTYGSAMLKMGKVSAITASHIVDCTRSVILGNYSTVAGQGSQIWTHGYYHCAEGIDRFRVDGRICLGNNVYIGSASVITAGVRIANHVIVGSHSSISKDLDRSGLYVSQPLRYMEYNLETILSKLQPVAFPCCDRVYHKAKDRA
jgi:UDP-3-O-[3-hydroxymyristoyl] glucosamine N-acyltransferase